MLYPVSEHCLLVERSVRTCVHVCTHTHTHTHTGIGSRNIASVLLGSIHKRAWAVITKYHKLGGLSNRNSFSHAKKKNNKKNLQVQNGVIQTQESKPGFHCHFNLSQECDF